MKRNPWDQLGGRLTDLSAFPLKPCSVSFLSSLVQSSLIGEGTMANVILGFSAVALDERRDYHNRN